MNKQISDTLAYIGDILNKEEITWVVGGSIILDYYGITNVVNDIDIIVDINDFNKTKELLSLISKTKDIPQNEIYRTKGFLKCIVNNVSVDIMADFEIKHNNGIYRYSLNEDAISKVIKINDISIPIGSLEDWYEIYQIIPGRDDKVAILEEYFIKVNKK